MQNLTYMTRRQIKKQAKKRLREGATWRNLMVANILPWLIEVVFTLITIWLTMQMINHYGINNAMMNPTGFQDYAQSLSSDSSKRAMFENVLSLWFNTGIAFTALDVYRRSEPVKPLKAVFRNFTGRFFFAVLAIYVFSFMLKVLGLTLFVIPGILIAFGLTMAYYVYYDAESQGKPIGIFTSMWRSWKLMRGFKMDYFIFELSLIGWYFLEAVTAHFFDFIIDPYLQLAHAGFYDNVVRVKAQQVSDPEE